MSIAALYDIHGNVPALEAVLCDVREADVEMVVVGGDVIPGPMPKQALDMVLDLDLPVHFLSGNGEREVLASMAGEESERVPEAFREVIRWVGEQMTPGQIRRVGQWPGSVELLVPELGLVHFCHATPRNDHEIFTRVTPAARLVPLFDAVDAPLVICGHTHMQFDRMIGSTRVVNAGSVGMPFGEPGAYWLDLGPDVELRRTTYDSEDAVRRIQATEYPQAEEFATGNVLSPPSEEIMVAAMERGALE